jgi:uncharacterized protein (UPF0303 family)
MANSELEQIALDLEKIALQERALRFDRFDEAVAWKLGSLLRKAAEAAEAPVVIDIRSHRHLLFCCALAGSSPDNWEWVRRKSNLVHRLHRSSYAFGLELRAKGATLQNDSGLDAKDFAAHGGGFPIRVDGAGFLGSITVSGLPQREDHNLVVTTLCEFLGKAAKPLALAAR